MAEDRERAESEAVADAQFAAAHSDPLGPGTAGYTTSGAAYRGREVASNIGAPTPAEPGFNTKFGLGYNDAGGVYLGYAPSQDDAGQ
ncbi:MAG TPA: hypothetical protein VK464_22630 [Symbiobacteriaceae bacterium]|jgi:hypothetical protein|nr:hypothetical protein [Symbiobacteriaceae bacterium]